MIFPVLSPECFLFHLSPSMYQALDFVYFKKYTLKKIPSYFLRRTSGSTQKLTKTRFIAVFWQVFDH